MRVLPAGLLDALSGSVQDARLVCHAWYDGVLVKKDLPIEKWSLSWDGSDTAVVQGKANLTVVDDTGELAPWGWDEPLSAAGSKLQAVFRCAGTDTNLGWWTVTQNQPNEMWRIAGANLQWVSGGASIPVDYEELTRLAADYRFWAPEAPPAGATVVSEVRRLMAEICAVTVAAGVADKPVPASMVYKDNHGAHVLDLVRSIGAWVRMAGDGSMEIYSQERTAPVWTIQGGSGGALVKVARTQRRTDILNGVASTSNDPALEIRKLATVASGPLRYGGPAGWLIQEHTALANTSDGVQADAQTYLDNKTYAKTLKLDVTCLPNPGIQIGDWVRVAQPVIGGKAFPLDGIVTAMTLSGGTAGVDAMSLTVEVSATDAATVGLYVRKQAA
ncbi:hypothetical protein [Pseudarthrobacter sp. S6]|uniref:hypothetical protein n=1 Tax=Pseudarthrobacter sp. S6 TaxID=3418420 RepID=UPI003CEF9249